MECTKLVTGGMVHYLDCSLTAKVLCHFLTIGAKGFSPNSGHQAFFMLLPLTSPPHHAHHHHPKKSYFPLHLCKISSPTANCRSLTRYSNYRSYLYKVSHVQQLLTHLLTVFWDKLTKSEEGDSDWNIQTSCSSVSMARKRTSVWVVFALWHAKMRFIEIHVLISLVFWLKKKYPCAPLNEPNIFRNTGGFQWGGFNSSTWLGWFCWLSQSEVKPCVLYNLPRELTSKIAD